MLSAALVLAFAAPGVAAVYEVGPGKAYANINDVPIEDLTAGDVLKIYYRSTPYREKFGVFGQGTSTNPITVQGIPGSGGELPIIDGQNATTRPESLLSFWGEVRQVFKIGGSMTPLSDAGNHAKWIVVENLHFRNANHYNTFTDRVGQTQAYVENAAAARIEYGDDCTFRNCKFTDSGNGFMTTGAGTERVTIQGCYYEGNGGNAADLGYGTSQGLHNNYTESEDILFEYNHFGPLITNGLGNALKDRSSGTIIRYNWLQYGNTILDLVDSAYDNIKNASNYGDDYCYGNILIDEMITGPYSEFNNQRIFHYGWDMGDSDRGGPWRFYNNTIITRRDDRILVFRPQTTQTIHFFNNILWRENPGVLCYLNWAGTPTLNYDHNILPTGIIPNGATADDPDTNVYNDTPGFADAANENYRLASGAAAIDIGTDIPGAWGHDVDYQYVKHRMIESRPSGATMDAGAYEYGTTGPLDITTTSLASGYVGEYYSEQVSATGGDVPYTWSISAGSLPSGLALIPSTGVISGTGTASGTSYFTVQVTDDDDPPSTDTQALSITMNTLTLEITTTSLPTGVVGNDYNQTVSARGGEGAYSWSIDSGTLPAGLSLNSSTGVISGLPTEADTDNFTVKVTDSATPTANTDTQSLSIQILSAGNTYESTSSNGQSDTQSTSFVNKAQLQFTPAYSDEWLIIAAAEIRGSSPGASCRGQVTLDGTQIGSMFWRPKLDTDWSPMIVYYTAFLDDTQHTINIDHATANGSYTGSIRNARIAAIRRGNLEMHGNVAESQTAITASEVNYVTLTFTPATEGRYLLLYSAEFKGDTATDMTIKAKIGSTVLDSVSTKVRRPYDDFISYASFSVESLTAQQHTAALAASGSTSHYLRNCRLYAVRLTDSRLASAVDASADTESSTTSTGFQQKLSKTWNTGGTGKWLILTSARLNETDTGDRVEARSQLDDTTTMNTVNRKPENATDWYNFGGADVQNLSNASHTIDIDYRTLAGGTAKIKYAHIAAVPLDFSEPSATLTVTTTSLADGTVGTIYSQQLSASGGVTPYTWSIDSGSLPAGLSLTAATGEISGTPTSSGTSSFTVKVTDSDTPTASTDTQALTITIYADLNITTTSLADATKNIAYNESLAATGGLAPYTWTLDSGWLPIGLSLSSAGVISGTPTSYGIFDFTVKCTDSQATTDSDTQALSITVHPETLNITTTTLPDGKVNTAYSQTVSATGGATPYEWYVLSGSLPTGLSLNTTTGVISGTPTGTGTSNFTMRVTDSWDAWAPEPNTDTQALSITVNAEVLNITTTSLPDGTVSVSYSETVSASGGVTPYTWSIDSGSLPSGLSLNSSTGVISGTPTGAGTSDFTIKVTDDESTTDTQALSIDVYADLTITTSSLPNGTVGTSYSQSVSASGGSTPYTWSIISGGPPAGITLNTSTGVLSGTPTTAGTSNFTVKVTDSQPTPDEDTQALSITINAEDLVITTTSLPDGIVGTAYSETVVATGGVEDYSWSIDSGSLPSGLSLNSSTGVISGTPDTIETANFTVKVTDSQTPTADTDTQALTIVVEPELLAITTTSLPDGQVSSAYSETVSATGGVTSYTWSIDSGSLPAGLSLNSSTGVISGTPTTSALSEFTVKVTDSDTPASTDVQDLSITIDPQAGAAAYEFAESEDESSIKNTAWQNKLTLQFTPSETDDWIVIGCAELATSKNGRAAKIQFLIDDTVYGEGGTQSHDTDPQAYDGMFFMKKINLDDSQHTVEIEYCSNTSDVWAYIRNARIVAFPKDDLEMHYAENTGSTWGSLSTTWTEKKQLQFTPGTAGDYLVIMSCETKNSHNGATGIRNKNGDTVLVEYKEGMNNGTGKNSRMFFFVDIINFAASQQTLRLEAKKHDSGGADYRRRERILAIRVEDGRMSDATESASTGESTTTSSSWQEKLDHSWSAGNTSYWLVLGSAGCNFQSDESEGVYVQMENDDTTTMSDELCVMFTRAADTHYQTNYVSFIGVDVIEDASGTEEVDIDYKSSDGSTTAKIKDVHIVAVPLGAAPPDALVITTNALPSASKDVSYSQTVEATGGITPYTWSIDSGSLPTGLSLNTSTGVISGTPTATGTSNFTVKVTDSQGTPATDTQALSIVVYNDLSISTSSLPDGTVGSSYNQTVSASGGLTPYSWSIISGSLPTGLAFNTSTANISGTPTAYGTFNFTVQVADSQTTSDTDTQALSITVDPATLVITTTSLSDGEVASSYGETLAATGGVTPYSWSIDSGSLPAGVSLNATTGVISGTPTSSGTSNFTIKVTDSDSPTASTDTQALSIFIDIEPLHITTTSVDDGETDVAYSDTVVASGGVGSYTWSIDSGSLPTGLSIASGTGVISGTPTATGVFNFTVKVTDSDTPTASTDLQSLSISISSGGPGVEFAESEGESTTTSTSWQNKLTLQFTPSVTDDYIILGVAELATSSTGRAAKIQFLVDDTAYGEGGTQSHDASPLAYDGMFFMKKINLDNTQHTVEIEYCANTSDVTAKIRRARIVAFRKDQLEIHYAENTGSTWGSLLTSWVEKKQLQFTPGSAGDYLVIMSCETKNSNKGATGIRNKNGDTVLVEYKEGMKNGTGKNSRMFFFVDVINFAASQQTLRLEAKKHESQGADYRRRERILAIRLTGGRLSDTVEDASTGESTTTSSTYQEKLDHSWSAGAHPDWLVLASAGVNFQSDEADGIDVLMQLGDATTMNNDLKVMFTYAADNHYQTNYASFVGVDLIQGASGTQEVDIDYKSTDGSTTAKIKDVHVVAIPLD
jgi:hypothetical protein